MFDFDDTSTIGCTRIGKKPILRTVRLETEKPPKQKDIPVDMEAIQACLTCTRTKCNGNQKCMERRKKELKTGKEVEK